MYDEDQAAPQHGDGTAPLQVQPGSYEEVLAELGLAPLPIDEREFRQRQEYADYVGSCQGWGRLLAYDEIEHNGEPHVKVSYERRLPSLHRLTRMGMLPGVVVE